MPPSCRCIARHGPTGGPTVSAPLRAKRPHHARRTRACRIDEGLLAMAAALRARPNEVWAGRAAAIQEALLFYDEHTFGAAESISDPGADNTHGAVGREIQLCMGGCQVLRPPARGSHGAAPITGTPLRKSDRSGFQYPGAGSFRPRPDFHRPRDSADGQAFPDRRSRERGRGSGTAPRGPGGGLLLGHLDKERAAARFQDVSDRGFAGSPSEDSRKLPTLRHSRKRLLSTGSQPTDWCGHESQGQGDRRRTCGCFCYLATGSVHIRTNGRPGRIQPSLIQEQEPVPPHHASEGPIRRDCGRARLEEPQAQGGG